MLNKFLLLGLLAGSLAVRAQKGEGTVLFSYDKAGNLTQRYIQVIPRLGKDLTLTKDTSEHFSFNVFPNPTSTGVQVEGTLPEGETNARIRLFTIEGKEMKQESYSGKRQYIDCTDFKPGVYVLRIDCHKKELASYKLIITK